MKKYLLCLSLCGALLLTGCGGKSLKCTKTEEEDGMKHTEEIAVKYSDDKVSSVTASIEMEVPDDSKEMLDSYKTFLESQFDSIDGAEVKAEVKGNRLTVTVEMDASKVSEDVLEDLDLKETLEETKKGFEEEGYTCK